MWPQLCLQCFSWRQRTAIRQWRQQFVIRDSINNKLLIRFPSYLHLKENKRFYDNHNIFEKLKIFWKDLKICVFDSNEVFILRSMILAAHVTQIALISLRRTRVRHLSQAVTRRLFVVHSPMSVCLSACPSSIQLVYPSSRWRGEKKTWVKITVINESNSLLNMNASDPIIDFRKRVSRIISCGVWGYFSQFPRFF